MKRGDRKEALIGIPDIGIPAEVLFNPELTDAEKILFGFLRNLSQSEKGCWASNRYLGKLINKRPQTITNAISHLRERQYILVQYETRGDGKNVRRIFINTNYPNLYRSSVIRWHENSQDPLLKNLYPPIKNLIDPYKKFNSKEEIEDVIEKRSPPASWKSLSKEYGQPKVYFTKKFLEVQQKNHPKKIQGDISPNHTRVLSSLDCLDKLCRIDGYDFETEVRPVLEQVPADKFWSRNLLSFGALRNSSANGETKFVNICNTLSSETPSSKPQQTPKQIIEQEFSVSMEQMITQDCFNPAWSLMSHTNNGAHVESELAQNIVDFIRWFDKKQQRPDWQDLDPHDIHEHGTRCMWEDEIPDARGFIEKYVEWLADQQWLDEITPANFALGNAIVQKFIQHHQKQIGLDIFTGERK